MDYLFITGLIAIFAPLALLCFFPVSEGSDNE